jgi:lipopolysaccharide heptosyltransferase III
VFVHYNCRFFLGCKPCIFKRECADCPHYAPFGTRILIIKLAAMGDVLRTTPLLHGLKRLHEGSHITWLTEASVVPMLKGIPEIDRLLPYNLEAALQLTTEIFDRLLCFDKEPRATALAMNIRAMKKAGFGMNKYGSVMPLNAESEYTFELGINDHLKFRQNRKTYPELIFECAGIPYREPQEYVITDLAKEIAWARGYLSGMGVGPEELKVGLNTGAGDVFATKKWTEEGYSRLADRLEEELGAKVLLLGGPAERERNERIAAGAKHSHRDTGTDHSIRRFSGIVGNCDLLVTGDTLAMHIAIALKVPVLAILGPTCHQEIELYGRGSMIVSDFDCSPCYLGVCPKERTCMDAISPDIVFPEAVRLIGKHHPSKIRGCRA